MSAVYVLDRRSTTEAEVFRYGLDRTHQLSSSVLNAKEPKGLALDGSFLYGTGESGDLFRLARTTAANTNAAVTIGSKALGDPAPRGAELRGGSLFLAGSTQIYRYPAVASFFPAGPDQQSNPVSPPSLEHTEAQGM